MFTRVMFFTLFSLTYSLYNSVSPVLKITATEFHKIKKNIAMV